MSVVVPSMRSSAARRRTGVAAKYFDVVVMSVCPRKSRTSCNPAPDSNSEHANERRKSWNRSPTMPARRPVATHAVFTLPMRSPTSFPKT